MLVDEDVRDSITNARRPRVCEDPLSRQTDEEAQGGGGVRFGLLTGASLLHGLDPNKAHVFINLEFGNGGLRQRTPEHEARLSSRSGQHRPALQRAAADTPCD